MDKLEIAAYLAGMFDGEGSIVINKTPPRGRGKSPSYRLVVHMTNTNCEVLQLAQQHYGGQIRGPFVRGLRWRASYRWELWDSDSLNFLQDVEPYIRGKREHIRFAFEFRERVMNSRTESLGKGHGSKPMNNEEVEAREAIYQKMKQLNRRGQPRYE